MKFVSSLILALIAISCNNNGDGKILRIDTISGFKKMGNKDSYFTRTDTVYNNNSGREILRIDDVVGFRHSGKYAVDIKRDTIYK